MLTLFIFNYKRNFAAGGVAQVVEFLPSKHKALSPNTSTAKQPQCIKKAYSDGLYKQNLKFQKHKEIL
jgi:hypothetical protein